MTLQTQLAAKIDSLDDAYRASMDAAIAHLTRTRVGNRGRQVGDWAPDFMLPDRGGRPVTLSHLLADGPVVLGFFRGEWCSFCRLEIDALIEAQPRIAERGAYLLMISPQGPTGEFLHRAGDIDGLTLLRDPMNGVGLQYGLIFRMPDVLREACLTVGIDLSHIYGSDACSCRFRPPTSLRRTVRLRLHSSIPTSRTGSTRKRSWRPSTGSAGPVHRAETRPSITRRAGIRSASRRVVARPVCRPLEMAR